MLRLALSLAAIAVALPVSAQVYKCTVGGTTTYSAQPCGTDAKAIQAAPESARPRPTLGIQRSKPAPAEAAKPAEAPAWVCQNGEVIVSGKSPCANGVLKTPDEMNAAELNAYNKALAAADARREAEGKAEVARMRAEEAKKDAALRALCGKYYDKDAMIGMTEEQFNKCSWEGGGNPTKNFTETAHGVSVQYVYRVGNSYRYYYFRNGVLTAKQN